MALSAEATESLLRAVDIIASSKVGEVSYDKTIICTIVDNSEIEKRGFYTVTDGKVRFKAYTNVTTYQVGDSIRVTIPNGDFNSKKYVDGPTAGDDSSPITYVSSLDSFLSMADLINKDVSGQLAANHTDMEYQNGTPIWSIQLNENSYADLQNNGIYDAIGLTADFKCLLGQYDIKQGNYGLRLDVKIKLNNGYNYVMKSFSIDSSEMFGNPYNYIALSTQQKMFNIDSIGTITEMTLYFYQNSNFIYYNGNTGKNENVPLNQEATKAYDLYVKEFENNNIEAANEYYSQFKNSIEYNIFVKNIQISFGTNIAKVADNTLKLYTLSDKSFNYKNPTDQTNTKTIGMLWYNKNELNQYLGFSDGIVDLKDGKVEPYDEIKYLTEQKKNIRLASQLGKDNVPKDAAGLELAALVDEAFIAVEEAKVLINTDLINTLKSCEARLEERLPEGFVIIDDNYVGPLQNTDNSFIKKFESDLDNKKKYLQDMLAFVAKVQRVQNNTDYWTTTEEAERPSEANGTKTLADMIDNKLSELQTIHNNTISKFESLISQEEFKQFKSSFDIFTQTMNNMLSLISAKFTEIKNKAYITDIQRNVNGTIEREEKTTLEEALNWYDTGKYTAPYIPQEDTEHANRYSIYWYRYIPGYIDSNTEFDFGGPEWERLIPEVDEYQTSSNESEPLKTIPYNFGVPSLYEEKDGIYYWDKKPQNDEGMLKIYLNPKAHQEKFKVILFYNHEKYESEPIIFTNLDDITSIYADKTSALSIEHIEDSGNNYQKLYSPNNFLYNQTEAKKNRAVRAVYNGVLGTTETVLVTDPPSTHIYWYIPRENSMIDVDYEFMVKPEPEGGGFTTNYVPTYRFKSNILKRLWLWNKWMKEHNQKSFNFFWDKPYGTNNSKLPQSYDFDEWLKFINPTMQIDESSDFDSLGLSNVFRGFKRVGDYLSLTEDFSTQSLTRKNDNTLDKWGGKWLPFPFRMFLPVLKEDGTIDTDNQVEEEIIEEVKDEHARDGYAYFYKKVENLDDLKFFYKIKSHYSNKGMNDCLSCLVETNNETFEASLNVSFGTQGSLGADYNFIIDPADKQSAVCIDKPLQVDIELYDYDNKQIPIYEYNLSGSDGDAYLATSTTDKSYIEWIGPSNTYQLHLKENASNAIIGGEISCNSSSDLVGAILALKASFKNSGTESKPDQEVTDNYKKTKLSNLTTFYSVPYATGDFYIEGATSVIYDNNGGNPDYYKSPYKIFESNGVEIGNVIWEIAYYSYNHQTGAFSPVNNDDDKSFCENYLPVLNQHNVLTPCATYLDKGDDASEYYAFIQCYNKKSSGVKGNIIWSQPIIVRKNRYAANMENSYDSSLFVNLDSGCIVSSLMNAFRRGGDTGKSLQGFMVGDLQNKDGKLNLGLYGFNSGQQSFGFGANGTSILGKNGGPQIRFVESDDDNEREYKIVSSSFADGLQGLKIDLEDGIIDIYGTKKAGEKRQPVDRSTGFFLNYSTQFEYLNLNTDNQKNSAHVYINAASSVSDSGYQKPTNTSGLPDWWSRWLGGGSAGQGRAVTKAGTSDIDASNALFKIEVPSAKSSQDYQPLILISDDNCLIQSNNYTPGQYTWNSAGGGKDADGSGMRIDLSYGTIDAYKLKISSNNILINSSGDEDPLFVVRDSAYKNLMYVEDGGTAFFLRSSDYVEGSSGMEIDVMNGNITSYNFSLHGESNTSPYTGSYIHIDSGGDESEPTFEFYLKQEGSESQPARDLSLLKISPSEFILNSPSYNESEKTGLSLNLSEGSIKSYNFSLRGESKAGYIYITSNDEEREEPLIELSSNIDSSDVKLLVVSPSAFELTSPDFVNGNGVNLDILGGNLEVKSNDVSLMSISNEENNKSFILTSADFVDSNRGMQIDVFNGSIEVRQSSALTLFHIFIDESDVNGASQFFMKSQDWVDGSSGMQIDLMNKKIEAYKTQDQKLIIDAAADKYPLQIGTSLDENRLKFRVDWDGIIYLDDSKFTIDNSASEGDGSGGVLSGGTFTWSNIRVQDQTGDQTGGKIVADTSIYSKGWIRAAGGLYGQSIYIKNGNDSPNIKIVDSSGNIAGTSLNINSDKAIIDSSGNITGTSLNINGNTATINNKGELAVQSITIAGGKASINSNGVLTVSSMGSSGGSGGTTDMGAISASTISATGKIESDANIKGATITSTNQLTAGSIQSNGKVSVKGNIETTNGGTITANGLLSGANISTNGTLSVGGVATFKQGIKFEPIDDTAASGTQNYSFTINPPETLTDSLSVRCRKLDVKSTTDIDGNEIQVLVVPSGITTAWVLY